MTMTTRAVSVTFRVMAAPSIAADPSARLSSAAAAAIRAAIRLAGGREVCFACTVDPDGIVQTDQVQGVMPDGSTGLDSRQVTVTT